MVQFGDTHLKFSGQSISKIFAYALLYDLVGGDVVHRYIGEEPSGQPFNAPVFDWDGRPHNPMVNTGAIMVCALIIAEGKGLKDLVAFYGKASGQRQVEVDQHLYEEESITGHKNHALKSLMLANNVFPGTSDVKQLADSALDLYFRACSLLVDTESLARFGAMLANNGILPWTGERVLKPSTVQAVVTTMTTCGMYNGAGKFTKELGIPSKSGISGGFLSVVPGVGAFATFSPRVNAEGNPVRGIGVIKKLSSIYNNLNLFHKDMEKRDLARKPY